MMTSMWLPVYGLPATMRRGMPLYFGQRGYEMDDDPRVMEKWIDVATEMIEHQYWTLDRTIVILPCNILNRVL